MKKLFAFISLFLSLGIGSAFADVTAKKLADGNVEVTFFYGNPRASEVLLADDFNNWQNGAEPMTKTDKGFTITKTFKASDELRYKFISDGNWTTDLKAPDFVDDGFGGKNGHVVVADLIAGDGDDSGAAKAKINFVSWSMFGLQANYLTQGVSDKSSTMKLDLDSVTLGAKSYNKFVGNFLPNCPVYIEIALAETEMEDAGHDGNGGTRRNYIYRKSATGGDMVSAEDGLKNLVSGLLLNPVYYLSQGNNNKGSAAGPGTNPFLGHLKFGFNTPYINFMTGFNYAKPDVRNAVTWTTISSSWDAGYQHTGGFNQFSLGSKVVAALQEKTGIAFDIGFAPNRNADRKGYRYGYWGWAGITWNDLVVDFQTNGMYAGDYAFYDPVEHDFILGVKDKIGGVSFAVQGLLATHQKSSDSSGEGIGAFDDDFRDSIKGAEFGGFKQGHVQGTYSDSGITTGLVGKSGKNNRNVTGKLALGLHYVECHDNYTLFDKLAISYWQRANDKTTTTTGNLFTKIGDAGLVEVKAENKLSAAYVFLSQGTAFLNGGQEFLRTKRGNENSYNTSNTSSISTNGIDLTFKEKYSDVYNVYKGLIALRKANPSAFGSNKGAKAETVSKGVTKYTTGDFLVYFNATDAEVNISASGYAKSVDVSSGTPTEAETVSTVPAKSFVILKK